MIGRILSTQNITLNFSAKQTAITFVGVYIVAGQPGSPGPPGKTGPKGAKVTNFQVLVNIK